jgi:hypothetical protein
MENSQEKKWQPLIHYLPFSAMFLDIMGNNWWVSFAEMEKLNIFYLLSI